MNAALAARKAKLLTARSTEQLILDLRYSEENITLTPEVRQANAWLSDEITSRLPEVDAWLERHFDDDACLTDERSYGQLIEAAIAELAL